MTDDELLAIFDKVARPSAGTVYEKHRVGLRAVAAAVWDEAEKATSNWYDNEHSPEPGQVEVDYPTNPYRATEGNTP